MNINETLPRYTTSSPLQTEFILNADHSGDHVFSQVKRQGDICLYKRTRLNTGRVVGYDLFRVKTVKAGAPLPNGTVVENDYEQYPTARVFGKTALFVSGMGADERAEELFNKWVATPDFNPTELLAGATVVSQVPETEKTVKTQPRRTRSPVNTNAVYVVPDGEFTQADFASANGLPPRGKVYGVLQAQVTKGLINAVGLRKIGKGRPTAFFKKAQS